MFVFQHVFIVICAVILVLFRFVYFLLCYRHAAGFPFSSLFTGSPPRRIRRHGVLVGLAFGLFVFVFFIGKETTSVFIHSLSRHVVDLCVTGKVVEATNDYSHIG